MIGMRRLRAYPDTSVFGGCHDAEFEFASRRFFREVEQGLLLLVVSDLTVAELDGAPPAVWNLFSGLPDDVVERVKITSECEVLRDAYLSAGVVGRASASDALHIAIATVVGADLVVSWNFKHIVTIRG
jgi:hypothetical protein